MPDTTREHLKGVAQAICKDDCTVGGAIWHCENGCIHPTADSVCPYLSAGGAVMEYFRAANLALVPREATEAMVDVACDVHDCPEKFRQEVINAAIREGDILKPGDGK